MDPDIVYGSGVGLWRFAGGAWTEIGGNAIHADQNALAWDGTHLVVGNDGGVYSRNEGPSILPTPWTSHNTNLAITQFYGGAAHPAEGGTIIAGAQDVGLIKRPAGTSPVWALVYGGDGIGAQAGPAAGQWMYWLQELNLLRSSTGGVSGQSAADNIGDLDNAPFKARVVACQSDRNVVLAGSRGVWRTNSFFTTPLAPTIPWAANSPALGVDNHDFVSAIAFAPSDPTCRTYAFAGDKGVILLTTDGGSDWTNLDPTNQVPGRYVTGLAFDPTSADIVYATLSGFDGGTPGHPGHVFKATQATVNPVWTNVSPPADLPADVVVVNPTLPKVVYVGSELGIWVSQDGGLNWSHAGPSSGLPNVPVLDLAVDPCGVTAFTFGRGAFRQSVPYVCP